MYIIQQKLKYLHRKGRLNQTKNYVQHGDVSVYTHCINVAYMSVKIAQIFHLNVNMDTLITGALLHDYFLYDWHDGNKDHRLHGFTHPKKALKNAMEDYNLSPKAKNIIVRHMFPLTIIPPTCMEAWIVCLADKICAIKETLKS